MARFRSSGRGRRFHYTPDLGPICPRGDAEMGSGLDQTVRVQMLAIDSVEKPSAN
jgi:hypothetical protein